MKRNLMSIQAYRDELEEKKNLILHVREKYPDIHFDNHDIFNHTLAELNSHVTKNLKHAQFMAAIQRIQRCWRRYKGGVDQWKQI